MRRRQRHGDRRIAILADLDVVDQPELVNIHWNFRVIDRLQDLDDRGLKVASRAALRFVRFLSREEPRQIVALAIEFGGHAGARRGVHRFDLFGLDLAFAVHAEKIRFTCSIPRTSA